MENRTVVGLAVAAVGALVLAAACDALPDTPADTSCQGARPLHAALAGEAKATRRSAPLQKAPAAPTKPRPAARLTKAPVPTKSPHRAGHGRQGGVDIDIDLDGC